MLCTKIICYISYGIIIFSSLIYNEIIIINSEIISRDTKINIIRRQGDEVRLTEEEKKKELLYNPIEDDENININSS